MEQPFIHIRNVGNEGLFHWFVSIVVRLVLHTFPWFAVSLRYVTYLIADRFIRSVFLLLHATSHYEYYILLTVLCYRFMRVFF